MSHIVTIQTQVRDPLALHAACRRLQLPAAVHGTKRLFSSEATGWQVQLPGWHYPVVCDTEQGQVFYDNYEGRWGAPEPLDKFLQAYAVEKTILEARRQGHFITEQPLANGSIQLTVQLGGSV